MSKTSQNRFIAPTRKLGAGKNQDKLCVIILAGGMTYRMKSYGPKCLFKLNTGITVIEQQINIINSVYPNSEIILTTGFEADRVIKRIPEQVRVVENQLFEITNIVEELRLALNNCIYQNVLIINSEFLFNKEAIDSITKEDSTILIDSMKQIPDNEVGVTVVDDKATIFSYGVEKKWSHIIYLTGKELKLLRQICADRERNKLYIFEAINLVLERRGTLKVIEPEGSQLRKIDAS